MPTKQSPVGSTPPEENGKTLEEELKTNTAKLVSALKAIEWGIYVIDMVRERDAIHSKHYARIEGENMSLTAGIRTAVESLRKLVSQRDNGWINRGNLSSIADFLEGLVAKHITSSPQGK